MGPRIGFRRLERSENARLIGNDPVLGRTWQNQSGEWTQSKEENNIEFTAGPGGTANTSAEVPGKLARIVPTDFCRARFRQQSAIKVHWARCESQERHDRL